MTAKCLTLALVAVLAGIVLQESAFAQSWTATNIYNNWTSVVMSSDGTEIAADSYRGGIFTSLDGGTNWQYVGAPDQTHWSVLAAAGDGGN